jgi:hypothetical protein
MGGTTDVLENLAGLDGSDLVGPVRIARSSRTIALRGLVESAVCAVCLPQVLIVNCKSNLSTRRWCGQPTPCFFCGFITARTLRMSVHPRVARNRSRPRFRRRGSLVVYPLPFEMCVILTCERLDHPVFGAAIPFQSTNTWFGRWNARGPGSAGIAAPVWRLA